MATIIGTPGNDELSGLGEDDFIKGLAGADILFGLFGNDEVYGDEGSDTIYGAAGNDLLFGEAGNDHLDGGEDADTLRGAAGEDTLDGGLGADLMHGGASDDTYIVDNTGDKLVERADGGSDVVYASVSYTLVDDVEVLFLTGTDDLSGSGNAGENLIVGNAGNNLLEGFGGNDQLIGGDGIDMLDGGTGADWMEGGASMWDMYVVDNAGDFISDPDGGYILSSISFDLRDTPTITGLTLTGTADIDARGNNLRNSIMGNEGLNILNGRAGNDTIWGGVGDTLYGGANNDQLHGNESIAYGGKGNDWYYLDTDFATQIAFENAGEGIDHLHMTSNRNAADVIYLPENFEDFRIDLEYEVADVYGTAAGETIDYVGGGRLFGGAGNDELFHSRGDDQKFPDLIMDGGEGDDRLQGYYLMAETLIGGAGADQFHMGVSQKIDTIADFEDGVDRIFLSRYDFNMNSGPLSAANFHAGAASADADDRVIYDGDTGALYYDSDGTGAAAQIRFALIAPNGSVITHEDFQVGS